MGPIGFGRLRSLGAGLVIAASILLINASPSSASPIFASGVITFTAPVSSLTVATTGGPATGGDQGFTFAVVPEPGAVGLVAAALSATFAARRRKSVPGAAG